MLIEQLLLDLQWYINKYSYNAVKSNVAMNVSFFIWSYSLTKTVAWEYLSAMDVRDGVVVWEALASRESCSRDAAMEHVVQEVIKKVESIGPIPRTPTSPSESSSLALGIARDLNCILARILMLSRRCPYEDVKKRCVWLLHNVQVGKSQVIVVRNNNVRMFF